MMERELESLPKWSQETMPTPKPQSLGAPLLTASQREREREKFEAFVNLRKKREWRVSINRKGRV